MKITTHAVGLEITEAIKTHVEKKFANLNKYFDQIESIEVELGMRNHHHNKGNIFFVEVIIVVPDQRLRFEHEAEDLYQAIDVAKDHLKVELEKVKQKFHARDKSAIRESKGYQEEI